MAEQPTLLITGASGRVGTAYRRHLSASSDYTLRYTDVKPPQDAQIGDWQFGDLGELDFAREIVAGADTILHLAADARTEAEFYASLLNNNINATHNIFAAAAETGARKVIFASSVQTVAGYDLQDQLYINQHIRPANLYGATKCWGEAVASVMSKQHEGLHAICVRIGWVTTHDELAGQRQISPRDLSAAVTERDLCHLFDCCLRLDGVKYAIANGVSNNRFPILNLLETRALFGYAPQDDAFALAGVFNQTGERA